MTHVGIWSITVLTILGILIRPKRWAEAVWASAGAMALVTFRVLSLSQALAGIRKGIDVYFFLAGMMLLSEMARKEGLFDWLASHAVRAAKGSRERLFSLVYLVGIGVTALLSNDATAVVLTPAVYAAVKKARATVLPYLFICAFIANAASFILPISNPANLVIFASKMPPLGRWLHYFALPSLLSITATFVLLRILSHRELQGEMEIEVEAPGLTPAGQLAALGIVATAIVLVVASALGWRLGLPTFLAALSALGVVVLRDRKAVWPMVEEISWGVLPLVAGLFVIVEGLDAGGAVNDTRIALEHLTHWNPLSASLAASFGISVICNIANNLPVGLLAGSALQDHVSQVVRNALVLGVDLGPNLSVSGSLATLLWLIALRREGEHVSFWSFLKLGALVAPPALFLATIGLFLGT